MRDALTTTQLRSFIEHPVWLELRVAIERDLKVKLARALDEDDKRAAGYVRAYERILAMPEEWLARVESGQGTSPSVSLRRA